MRYVFFGTPAFAQIILEGLIKAGMPPVAVVCNPDKPVGRKQIITSPPTKALALANGIEVFQPANKKELMDLAPSLGAKADFAVVAAYAIIIPQGVIDQFKLGVIGVHPSLLPKFRGPSPIQSAILAGVDLSGTTLFMISRGVDDGPILEQHAVRVENENYVELMEELAQTSCNLLISTLPLFVSGRCQPQAQDEKEATLTSFFGKDSGLIQEADLKEALEGNAEKSIKIWRTIRALNPEPGVYTVMNNQRTKLLDADLDGVKLVLKRIQKEGKKPESI